MSSMFGKCRRVSRKSAHGNDASALCSVHSPGKMTLIHPGLLIFILLVHFHMLASSYKLGRGRVRLLDSFRLLGGSPYGDGASRRPSKPTDRRSSPKPYAPRRGDAPKVYESANSAPRVIKHDIPEPYVVLVPGKARLFKEGNPLLFGGVIDKIQGNPKAGELITVADHNYNVFAKGFYNPHSQYRVRLLTWRHEVAFNSTLPNILRYHIQSALHKRTLINLPSKETNSYRLVNGEGDQLSGLMVDILGDNVVIQSSAIWIELYAKTIVDILSDVLMVDKSRIVWKQSRSRLEKDGIDKLDEEDKSQKDTVKNSSVVDSSIKDTVILENGLRYVLTSETEQKTGFYCDQRDNRIMLRGLCANKSVLDTYCYTGGFSLNALVGGASHITAVDSSKAAIECARKNLAENMLDGSRVSFLDGDAVQVMNELFTQGKSYDIVICDPPKLAPQRKVLAQASTKYQSINTAAMKLVNREHGGLLLTCTCSAAMSEDQGVFLKVLQEAAKAAQREITVMSVSGAASDHVLSPAYQEGKYLTAVLLYVR